MVDTQIIDGKAVAAQLRTELANEVKSMSNQPGLAVILVGDDPASKVYVGSKIRACEQVGIKSYESRLSDKTTEAEIAAEIKAFDDNKDVHGILLQLPLPYPLDSDVLVQSITPEKDVDGLTYLNAG